jgi:hypothetical protein
VKSRKAAAARRPARSGMLGKVAAWIVIVTMSIPIVCLLVLALPWFINQPQLEAHLSAFIPNEVVATSLARPTTNPAPAEPMPMPSEWENDPSVCAVRVATLDEFSYSGTVVALAGNVFDTLNLAADPWVEITTPAGIRMGAMAVRKNDATSEIYIRRTMAWALEIDRSQKAFVKVAPVQLVSQPTEEGEMAFRTARQLAKAYCESSYSVGIGLSVMQEANLTPGSYAIAKGPSGYQSVKIQVMDRGNPEEIWLSPKVWTAIGINNVSQKVILYPRHPLRHEKRAKAPSTGEAVTR